MAVLPDSQDVTLACADSDILQCWGKKVKQRKECFLLLEYKNGKVLKSEARAPTTDSKSLAEIKKKKKGEIKLSSFLHTTSALWMRKDFRQAT